MEEKKLTICFFGIYNHEYARNCVLINGLKQNGVKILECRSDKNGLFKYLDLIKKHWEIRKHYDVLFVAFPGFQTMILARFLTRKKIVFDLFAPIYESEVFDRKTTKKGTLKAKYYCFLDWLSCKFANKILLDTNENIKYFVRKFNIKREKFYRLFVGTDISIFNPREKKESNKFVVHFHGTNIPLQGIEYILESAKILEKQKDIQFNIIGSSVKKQYGNYDLKNINFKENVPYEKLCDFINQSDICLGIFGNTGKTQKVIPNKVYECIACRKPVITADTPAIKELFNENDLYLIPRANPEELSKAILELKGNSILRGNLSQNGYNKLTQNCTPKILGEKLIDIINEK
ncbi:glycosyltransferase [Patescibacteria group bacterium]|nr:glycosyltransferase [Patescibacteria group bacterium]